MDMNKLPQISFVIPLFNEENVFVSLIERLNSVMNASSLSCEVLLVDDGSTDATSSLMRSQSLKDTRYHSVFLSRNFGHQLALSAGIEKALGSEGLFILDGDLQDPPELLDDFYAKLKDGFDVVYAIRRKRKEPIFKRLAYKLFYRILDRISYIKIPLDSGDFGMVSRRVANNLIAMPEQSRYIRGLRTWIGFKQIGIEYERDARVEGVSKYSFSMLLKLASEGIFNFSQFPIKFITRLGFSTIMLASIYLVTVLFKRLFFNTVPEGFTALLIAIIMFSGVILFSIGVIGEYILRIFFEVKRRPLTIVSEEIKHGKIIQS